MNDEEDLRRAWGIAGDVRAGLGRLEHFNAVALMALARRDAAMLNAAIDGLVKAEDELREACEQLHEWAHDLDVLQQDWEAAAEAEEKGDGEDEE